MRPRLRLIYNPRAGKQTFRQHLAGVLQILEEAGFEASTFATKEPGDATAEAERAARDGFSYVVACGGDGTVHEVVNGLARAPVTVRPVLGVIPAGTTNDLARALRIPFQIGPATRLIAARQVVPLDLGLATADTADTAGAAGAAVGTEPTGNSAPGASRYFVNIAACGQIAEITYEVPAKAKAVLGQLAYVFKGLERLPGLRPTPLSVETDGPGYRGDAMLCLVTNSRSVGGFEQIAPDASVNDGLLDVLIVKPTNLGDMIRLVTSALRGEHIGDDRLEYFQAREIRLSSQGTVDLNVDGEYGGRLPYSVRVMPRHLTVVADI